MGKSAMGRLSTLVGTCGLLVTLGLLPATASAIVIRYEATDLADAIVGEDLWRYDYVVGDHAFLSDQGFAVYFDPALYTNLESPPPGVPDWDLLVIQPDTGIPAAGFYDALALVSGPSLAQPFSLSFVWLGAPGSAPGAQPFELYHLEGLALIVDQEGRTSPIPEPSALLLMGSGLTLAWRRRRRSS